MSKIVQKDRGTRFSHCSSHCKTVSNSVCLSEGATVTKGGRGLPIGQWHADCRNVHQSCCPWIECSFLYHNPTPKSFQRIWQYIQRASQPQTTCNHTSPGSTSSIFTSKIVWDQPPWQLLQQSVYITKEFLHKLSETVSGKLICMLVVLIGLSTWLQFVVITDLSGQMLTFDGVWHFGEVFSSRMNPGFHCTGQMADSMYGVMWLSGLLMSTLWIEWPMVTVALWYGQTYVMDIEHRCILLMAFWMHRDTVTRSWGPLLCHSSTTITSCCSMIMHGRVAIPGSWKHHSFCMNSILTGHVTHWACLGCSGSAYMTACSSSCQYPATSHNHWRGVDQHSTGHSQQPDRLYAKEMCCTAWGKDARASWYATPVRWIDYLGNGEVLTNTDLEILYLREIGLLCT